MKQPFLPSAAAAKEASRSLVPTQSIMNQLLTMLGYGSAVGDSSIQSIQSLDTNTSEGNVLSLCPSASAWNDHNDKSFSIEFVVNFSATSPTTVQQNLID